MKGPRGSRCGLTGRLVALRWFGDDGPGEEELVGDDFGRIEHGVEELGDVALLVALPVGIGGFGGGRVVMTVCECFELFDEAVVGMDLRSP